MSLREPWRATTAGDATVPAVNVTKSLCGKRLAPQRVISGVQVAPMRVVVVLHARFPLAHLPVCRLVQTRERVVISRQR
jgi:hypothetical protein